MKYLILFFSTLCFSQTLQLNSFATGFDKPVEIVHAGDSRLFVVEQSGRIKILNSNGSVNSTPFLNISSLVSTGFEQGLLGLAFHPNYALNGFFYVSYTRTDGDNVIARYSVNSSNSNEASTVLPPVTILTIDQPLTNHNGGCIKFGPDGYLYIAIGDGGGGNDPGNRALNNTLLLGKLLRIDINSGSPYNNPNTNPFVGVTGADEIWALGLRNPWKFSFDLTTNNLWIADVGQNAFEEINRQPYTLAGLNYGWRCYEGNANTPNTVTSCSTLANLTSPFAVVNHNVGACSITGGYVYRGSNYPNLVGKYLFSDYCDSRIGIVTNTGSVTYSSAFTGNFVTFGEDLNKELYIADISGTISKIIDTSLQIQEFINEDFKIFPNPVKNEIRFSENNLKIKNYVVFNILGIEIEKGNFKNTISSQNWAKGIYFINVEAENGISKTFEIIKE